MTTRLAHNPDSRLVEAAPLVADSLLPVDLWPGQTLEIYGDAFSDSIIDNTGDYDLGKNVMSQIESWIYSAIFEHLRTQISQVDITVKNNQGKNILGES